MSPVARRPFAPTSGNTALALSTAPQFPATVDGQPAALPGTQSERTPLSVVRSVPRKRRTPLVVLLFAMLVAALATVLVINVSISRGQYDLVGLKAQQSQLVKTNQDLEQQLGAAEAPQNLVARAKELGMVPAGTMGQIDVTTGKVSGDPQPATDGTANLAVIPPASIDTPAETAKPNGPESPAAAAAKAEESAPGPARPGTQQAAAAPVTPDLNGGSIPAPVQKGR